MNINTKFDCADKVYIMGGEDEHKVTEVIVQIAYKLSNGETHFEHHLTNGALIQTLKSSIG